MVGVLFVVPFGDQRGKAGLERIARTEFSSTITIRTPMLRLAIHIKSMMNRHLKFVHTGTSLSTILVICTTTTPFP